MPDIPERIGGVMVSVLASSAVDCEFEAQLDRTKDYKIGICAKYATLRRKSKGWLARNQDILFPSGATCLTATLLFQ
jgi:hypothetical protein